MDACGTFAWAGKYFYFPDRQGSPDQNKKYWVFAETGTLLNTFSVTGEGGLSGLYFDWSVGRYTSHDGWGQRKGGTEYACSECTDDSQSYGPPSPYHSL